MTFAEVLSLSYSLFFDWAWLILPLAAFHVGWYAWVMYRELLLAKEQYESFVYLRVHLPHEIEATAKSMEQVFHSIHGVLGHIRPYEKLILRERQPWFSFEMVGINGNLYFIIAVDKKRLPTFKEALFSEYPDIEFEEISDYTLSVPMDIPNKELYMHGYEFVLGEEDIWRFKVYEDWEMDKESFVGRKFDPISQWAEVCSDLKPGEHLWFQFIISAVASNEKNWFSNAVKVRRSFDKPSEPEEPMIAQIAGGIGDFFRILGGYNLSTEEEEKKPFKFLRFPSTIDVMIVKVLGSKIERPVFDVNVRAIYIAPRDIYANTRKAAIRGFVRPFADYTNNYFKAQDKTETRITRFMNFFPETRLNLKRRRALWYYRMRYLRQEEPRRGQFGFSKENHLYRLNTQELASLYHFPGREVSAPGLRRLPFKKAKPPVDLPTV